MVIFYSFFFLFFFAIFLEVCRLKDGECRWMVHGSGMMIARIIFMRTIESNLLLLKDTWYRNHNSKIDFKQRVF